MLSAMRIGLDKIALAPYTSSMKTLPAEVPKPRHIGVGAEYDGNLNASVVIYEGVGGKRTVIPVDVALAAQDMLVVLMHVEAEVSAMPIQAPALLAEVRAAIKKSEVH